METLFFIAGGFCVISISAYIYKYCMRKDYGYLLLAASRSFVLGIFAYFYALGEHIPHETFLLIIAIMLMTESANSCIYIFSKKYILEINKQKVINEYITEDFYYNNILNGSVGFFIVDSNKKLIYLNDALSDILGYSREEILGKDVLEYAHSDDKAKVEKEINEKLIGGKGMSIYDFRIVTKEGKVKTIRVISSLIRNGHVSITGSVYVKEE